MDSLSKFIEFLNSKGYKLIKNNERLKFSIYEYEGLFIKIVQDVDLKRFIDLSRTNNHSWQGWYDMGIIRHFILKMHYQKGGPTTFEHLSQFFIDYYEKIMDAFSPETFITRKLHYLL